MSLKDNVLKYFLKSHEYFRRLPPTYKNYLIIILFIYVTRCCGTIYTSNTCYVIVVVV